MAEAIRRPVRDPSDLALLGDGRQKPFFDISPEPGCQALSRPATFCLKDVYQINQLTD
jgi:hypothetical protein